MDDGVDGHDGVVGVPVHGDLVQHEVDQER